MARGVVWVGIIVLFAILVIGFFLFNSTQFNTVDQESDDLLENSEDSQVGDEESDDENPLQDSTPSSQVETKEFDMIAKQWDFSPASITVNEGDKVILNVKSIDVTHGFAISDFGVSESLSSGNTVRIEFIADKKGTFSFFCNVFCGSGHGGMRGTLTVN